MKTEDTPEQTVPEEQIREALKMHWQASAAGDANAEHDIYADDAICDYPQSGERILGRNNLQAPWLGISGFVVLSLMLSLLVFVGEAVRDAFDPRKSFR